MNRHLPFALPICFLLAASNALAEPFRMGVMLCQTGNCADWGTAALKGAKLAAEEINARGGVLSRPIELVVEDTNEAISGAKTVTAFQSLLAQDVHYFIGPSWSPGALSIAPLAAKHSDIVIITPSASAREFSREANFIFNVRLPEEYSTRALAQYAHKLHKRRAAIFSSQQPAESTQGKIFEDEFKKLGGEIAMRIESSPASADLRTEALKIVNATPDVVFLMNYNQIESGAKELTALGYRGLRLAISLDDARTSDAKGVLDGIVVAKAAEPTDEFKQKFEKSYGTPPGLSAEGGYDAVGLVAQAIAKENNFDPAKVKTAIRNLKYSGATGEFTFTSNREIEQEPIIRIVRNGKLEMLK